MASFGTSLVVTTVGASYFPDPNKGFKPVTKQPLLCSISRKGITGLSSNAYARACRLTNFKIMASTTEIEKLGIKIVKNPPESTLSDLGVRSWPK